MGDAIKMSFRTSSLICGRTMTIKIIQLITSIIVNTHNKLLEAKIKIVGAMCILLCLTHNMGYFQLDCIQNSFLEHLYGIVFPLTLHVVAVVVGMVPAISSPDGISILEFNTRFSMRSPHPTYMTIPEYMYYLSKIN